MRHTGGDDTGAHGLGARLKAARLACAATLALMGGAAYAAEPTFSITYVDNAQQDFASRGWLAPGSAFQTNIAAAAATWGSVIDSGETLAIEVRADNSVARTGGTFTNGQFLGFDGQGQAVWQPGPLTMVLTGANPGGPPEIFIAINSAYVEAHYWFDPTPDDRLDQTAPPGTTDFVSIVLHELGHGLGMAGTRNFTPGPDYGTFPGFLNSFDALSEFGGDGNPLDPSGAPNPLLFTGAHAAAVYGGDVPLSHVGSASPLHSQDFYHLGTCGDPGLLTDTLMNGCSVPTDGSLLVITPLDLAVMQDLGYPLHEAGWIDAGGALAGVSGEPGLSGTGLLLPGAPGTLALTDAAPDAFCLLFVSLASTPTPFLGGTLKTVPVLTEFALTTGPAGTLSIPYTWPSGVPSGFEVWVQYAIADAAGPFGASLSNALKGTAP